MPESDPVPGWGVPEILVVTIDILKDLGFDDA
jgi:hypothetical protein